MAEDAKAEVVKATPSGLMVALKLQPELAAKVALPDGLPAAELHCTLAYCGRTEDLPADAQDRARAAVEVVAAEFGPFVGVLGGVGRFNASGTSDGKDVLHATLDAPLLPPLREALVAALEKAGLQVKREHGFDPHVTLRYEPPGGATELPAFPSRPAVFPSLWVATGETQVEVPLTGTRVVKAEALIAAGVPARAALVRAAAETGADAGVLPAELVKARGHSPEFLEEVYRQVREKCPPWVADAIRDSAKPRAGARARARRREDAAAAAPSVLERLALRGVQPAHLEDLDEPGIKGAWEKLREWHGAAKRRAEPAEEVLGAARHFAAEFKRRNLALAEDDELVLASTLAGPGEGARVAKLLKARSRAEKQIVYGVVLDPYRVDAHNDWPPPADVEATAHGWLEKYRDVPLWHINDKGYRPMAAIPVESWLEAYPSPEDYAAAMKNEPHTVWRRQFGSDMVHSGTWIIGVRLPDDLWATYQRGEIDAFSIQGFGMKRPATRAEMPKVTVIDLVEAR